MKGALIKAAVAVPLTLLAGMFLFLCIRFESASSPLADFVLPLFAILAAFLMGVVIMLFLPPDIKTWRAGKKLVFGIAASLIGIVAFFAAFLLAALTLGPLFL